MCFWKHFEVVFYVIVWVGSEPLAKPIAYPDKQRNNGHRSVSDSEDKFFSLLWAVDLTEKRLSFVMAGKLYINSLKHFTACVFLSKFNIKLQENGELSSVITEIVP